jgi:PST family polysaccharide transporter
MLLYSTVGWIHLSIGKPGRWLRWTLVESASTALLFVVALPWGPAGIAVAWSASFWTLLIPAFWYAGRPIGFGVSSLIGAVWRYAAASLGAGLGTAAIIQRTPFWGTPPGADAALGAIIIISALFVTLYLATVILLHWGCAPLRQFASLLREAAQSRRVPRPAAELV